MFRYLILFSWIVVFILLLLRFKEHLVPGPVQDALESVLMERDAASLVPLETKEESKEVLIAIIRLWDFEKFYGNVHPDLRHVIPAGGLRELFRATAESLGALHATHSTSLVQGTRNDTKNLTVKLDGTFLKGRAVVEAEFLITENGWKIFQFAVESPVITPVYEAAQAANLDGSFDASVFRKGLPQKV